ncbi:hypothetical protein V8J88_05720 [Massilia sp. W12]|uniref:hypothetical protein n=1 Tax=Massilia sp. W12 TaxID=3126507 RepID=UPI0030D324EA
MKRTLSALFGAACINLAWAQSAPPAADEAAQGGNDGWKVSGHVSSLLGWQAYNPDSVYGYEGSGTSTSQVSRKVQSVLKVTSPGKYTLVWDGQYDFRPYGQDKGRVNQFNLSVDLSSSLKMRVGKQRVLWGRGFIYVPTDLINPPIDPSGLDVAKVGVPALSFDWVRPDYAVTALVRRERGRLDSVGVKYSPAWKSGLDLDFIAYHGPSTGNAVGASYSIDAEQILHPKLSGLVLFGGWAMHTRSRFPALQQGVLANADGSVTQYPAVGAAGAPGRYHSWLLGASYQADGNVLILGELYHIGDALSKPQLGQVIDALAEKTTLRATLSKPWLNQLSFGRSQRNYFNLSISKGPLTEGSSRLTDTFNVEVASLRNLADHSGMNSLAFISNYWDRSEITLRTLFPYGRANSEFGSVPYKWYAELSLKIGF